ncbi:MAG: histidine phosphatase family protein [Acidimicrobiia bacterium]|nr:histidine phosphatase family protein [Acidimicrobiia bacterium]
MTIHLLRHAKAGSRRHHVGPDIQRALTKAGLRQAHAIAEEFESIPVDRIISSEYVRCRETVTPLAHRRRLPVDLDDALAEGASWTALSGLLRKLGGTDVVLCTHGDVIGNALENLSAEGVTFGDDLVFPKGSVWVLETVEGDIVSGHHVPAPSS